MARLTRPGISDQEWMSVTCTPASTSVDFHETDDDAMAHARANLLPTTSVYVGKIAWQGENTKGRPPATCLVMAEVDDELKAALRELHGHTGRLDSTTLNRMVWTALGASLTRIRDDYRQRHNTDDQKTQAMRPGNKDKP